MARTDLGLAPDPAIAVLQHLVAAFNDHDADAFAALFTTDAWFVNVLGHRLTGRAEIAEAHRYVFAMALAGSRVECTDVSSRILATDVALVEAVWSSTEGPQRTGIMLLVVRRDEHGTWAIVHCANSEYEN